MILHPLETVTIAGMDKVLTGESEISLSSIVDISNVLQFTHRYIPSTKPVDVPSNSNTRHNQFVAQQVHTLKTTINHLKNAYNGNDIEWSDTGKAFDFNHLEFDSMANG